MYQLEVIAFNIQSCLIAEKAGANRIELCDNPGEGGTTPSYGMIKTAREKTSIQLFPIIRPRGGDFLYTDEEFTIMLRDVLLCKELGCDGVVVGMLKEDGKVDLEKTSRLVEAAYPMGVTFHRAFDRVFDHRKGLEDVIRTGCERILTSGLQPTVTDGAETLKELVDQADGRIIIMPGSGLRSTNLAEIAQQTGATEFHSSARKQIASAMSYQSPRMGEQLMQVILDEEEVRQMKLILQQLPQQTSTD
jgi:copper homeostasis protein